MSCSAWTRGQEKYCNRCGFVWDISDPEPPKCLTDTEAQAVLNDLRLMKLRKDLDIKLIEKSNQLAGRTE